MHGVSPPLPAQDAEKSRILDVSDMMRTFWRLITNPTLMCNNLASVFYFLGYMPYWVFMAKYIETQYRQSASTSSLVTGKVQLSLYSFFWGAFAKLRKAIMSFVTSVCPHGTTRLPQEGISLKFYISVFFFLKLFKKSNLIKIRQE